MCAFLSTPKTTTHCKMQESNSKARVIFKHINGELGDSFNFHREDEDEGEVEGGLWSVDG